MCKLFIQTFFMSVILILIGTIDFYHFIPLSVTVTLAGGHKGGTKPSLLVSFLTHFSFVQNEI